MSSVYKWIALIVSLVPCLAFGAPAPLPAPVPRGNTVTVKWELEPGPSAKIFTHHIRPGVFIRDYLLKTTVPQGNPRYYRVCVSRKQDGKEVILPVDLVSIFAREDSWSNYLLLKGDVLFILRDRRGLLSSDTPPLRDDE